MPKNIENFFLFIEFDCSHNKNLICLPKKYSPMLTKKMLFSEKFIPLRLAKILTIKKINLLKLAKFNSNVLKLKLNG